MTLNVLFRFFNGWFSVYVEDIMVIQQLCSAA